MFFSEKPVVLDSSDGWADFTFPIKKVITDKSGHTLLLRGKFGKQTIGLAVVLPLQMRCGLIERGDDLEIDQDRVYHDAVEFHSLGTESDAFLSALASAYGIESGTRTMKKVLSFTCIVLDGDWETAAEKPMKCKLFYGEDDDGEDEADFYFNVNLANRTAQIHEKDPDYRANLIRALSM